MSVFPLNVPQRIFFRRKKKLNNSSFCYLLRLIIWHLFWCASPSGRRSLCILFYLSSCPEIFKSHSPQSLQQLHKFDVLIFLAVLRRNRTNKSFEILCLPFPPRLCYRHWLLLYRVFHVKCDKTIILYYYYILFIKSFLLKVIFFYTPSLHLHLLIWIISPYFLSNKRNGKLLDVSSQYIYPLLYIYQRNLPPPPSSSQMYR